MSVRDTTPPSEMRAARCHAVRDYRLETLPVPSLSPGELLVRVTRCGICAGDAKCYNGAPMFWGDSTREPYVQTPVTPGHEFCGVVVEGERRGFEVGDAVTAEQVVACGECYYCLRGWRWLCAPHDIFGFHCNVQGGLAEYMVFPVRARVYKLPKGMNDAEQVYIEPLSCALHGVERGDIQFGDTVVVSGCGPIGLGMVMGAKRKGAARVIAVDCWQSRLDVARECGADICLKAGRDDVVKSVMDITDVGCDVFLEAAGVPQSVKTGVQLCRKRARFVEFGVFGKMVELDWTVVGDTKELEIRGGHCSGDRGYRNAIDLLASGAVPTERIVTHSLALQDLVRGINLVGGGEQSIKVTIDPNME